MPESIEQLEEERDRSLRRFAKEASWFGLGFFLAVFAVGHFMLQAAYNRGSEPSGGIIAPPTVVGSFMFAIALFVGLLILGAYALFMARQFGRAIDAFESWHHARERIEKIRWSEEQRRREEFL